MNNKKVNLFIYGSLRDQRVFQSVSGLGFSRKKSRIDQETLFADSALLSGYRKVSPDNVYYYAIKAPSSNIEGLVIYDVPAEAMAEIDKYEGKRYERETVKVNTAAGHVNAQAYLVSHDSMEKHFGDRFHVNLIHELWLRKRIEKFLKKHTRPGERSVDAEIERRADRELLGTTERDLVMSHYRSDAVSDYYLERELDRPRPSIKHLYNDENARRYINNYLSLVVKQVLLSQLEEQIQSQYRFELDHMRSSKRYFNRSISLLIALHIINSNSTAVELITEQCLQMMPFEKFDLIDYVKYAVHAARSMFESRVVYAKLNQIRSNFNPGLVPLGLEVELSNLGPAAVEPQRSSSKEVDYVYDGFKYYYDFCLDVLSWKLGGYIDDHSGSTDRARRSGFLELAPGRLNIAGELSRPATACPWLLNQLINEIVDFYNVHPHSLHLSFQLRKRQIDSQKILSLGFAKCLLAMGGGPELKGAGRLWVSRIVHDEITQRVPGNDRRIANSGYDTTEELVFARTSKRKWYLGGDEIANKGPTQSTANIQQYKFIRLQERTNYEPLIMGLKGLQLSFNPGDYLNADQLKNNPKLREQYHQLKQWAAAPTEIGYHTISKFIKAVKEGLMNEAHHRPAHKLHYIDWVLSEIDVQLRMFNQLLKKTQ